MSCVSFARTGAITSLVLIAGFLPAGVGAATREPPQRPNILMIMSDDVGITNVGAYSHGMMVPTPNIDRIAKEGMLFTDHYAEPSCTAGRAAFITGQMPIRTGLTTVGLPGSPIGLDKRDPTLAEVLKGQGYRTGQFGKNHLGDRNEHLPTVHGFDEFYGNVYHLNTEEEPFLAEWPKDPGFNQRYRPRGVLDCKASDTDDETVDARFGKMGKQRCKDTGPLDPKRMETVDDEFEARAVKFMSESVKDGKPFFAWIAPTRMHIYTHLRPEHRNLAANYSSSLDVFGSGMMELDMQVGRLLDKLKELRIADNTIVLFTADNGAMAAWYPDGGTTPFRGEKATTWEGGVRVPMLIRWPAAIAAGKISNGIQANYDLFVTLAAAAGVDNIAEKLKASHGVHIDGVNNLGHWTGEAPSARNTFIYYNEATPTAVRIGPWKSHFQVRDGFFDYLKPAALVFNLRMDPFEQRDGWKSQEMAMRLGVAFGGQFKDIIGSHFRSLKEFPPRQPGGSLRMGLP